MTKKTWDAVHRERQWGRWPGEHVVRFLMRRYGDIAVGERPNIKFLDVGCGVGANTWLIAHEGFSVYGIDSSPAAIDRCAEWMSGMIRQGNNYDVTLECMNATKMVFPADTFDCAIDSCCLQHFFYPREHALAVAEIHRILKPGGRFFSVAASQRHDERAFGGMEASRLTLAAARTAFEAFEQVQIHHAERSDPRHGTVAHYLIEGVKSPR